MTSKTIVINLAQELKIKPKKVLGVLTTSLGSFVEKGHPLAVKKGLLKTKKVLSPVNGILEKVKAETGELIIKVDKVTEVKTVKKEKVEEVVRAKEVEAQQPMANDAQTTGGFGKGEGELVGSGKELTPEALKKEFSGKVLVVESLPSAQAVFKANALGIAGIVISRELTPEEIQIRDKVCGKVGLALLAKKVDLKRLIGKRVLVDGEKGTIEVVK